MTEAAAHGAEPDAADAAEPDQADAAEEIGPLRRCLVTGERRPRETMLRFVVGPDGTLVPDLAATLPGRGYWLSAGRDVVALGLKKRAFDRAARRPVTVDPALADQIETLLARRCVEDIGLARRAGVAVAGFEKVAAALRQGSVGVLLAAAEGAADGRRKLTALAPGVPVVAVLTTAELGQAFGRDHAVHASVAAGKLAERLRIDATRLAGFRRGVA
jgi:predicted RNA-binding protein YlxR (DUF448 family)/ribosomal protein L30E